MIPRAAEPVLRQALERFPAVGLVGPRQAGKTTLALEIASSLGDRAVYLDLELPSDRAKLQDAAGRQPDWTHSRTQAPPRFREPLAPLNVLLANSIVQNGHGMLPLLAHSRRELILVQAIRFAAGLSLGALALAGGI